MAGVALLGAGIFAREAHIPALLQKQANLLAIYSRSTKSANDALETVQSKSKAEGASTITTIEIYSDEEEVSGRGLDDLLRRSDITAVIIALPILVQPDVVRRCLAAGKHVLCEKPIAKDVSTAQRLITEYESAYAPKKQLFAIAEQLRYDPSVAFARDLVQTDSLGKLHQVHSRVWLNVQPGQKFYETQWRKEPGYQGGFILDGGVHYVASIRAVTGQEFVETASIATQVFPHLPPVDTVNAALRLSGGVTGSLSISYASSKRLFEFIFLCDRGSVTLTDGGPDKTKMIIDDTDGTRTERLFDHTGVYEEISEFLDAAASGSHSHVPSPREALEDLLVIESICSGGVRSLSRQQ